MNHLNSVLIEGIVYREPTFNVAKKFVLESFTKENEPEEENIYIEVYFNNLLNSVYNKLNKGSELRIVGKLKSIGKNIVINAEHIEIKQRRKNESSK
ncbi:MAG: single-stranded DNA-binding protein [Treponema sp.]|nr:single-stranded DNA-binding protein [Treponema sp.]